MDGGETNTPQASPDDLETNCKWKRVFSRHPLDRTKESRLSDFNGRLAIRKFAGYRRPMNRGLGGLSTARNDQGGG